jgi:syndecan 4
MWNGGAAYTELVACPAAGAAGLSASEATLADSLSAVFSGAIWATPLSGLTTDVDSDGITVSTGSCTLVWKAVSSSVRWRSAAAVRCSTGSRRRRACVPPPVQPALTPPRLFALMQVSGIAAATGAASCSAGSYQASASVCALCRAGSYAAGASATSCTTVAKGKALSTVGASADGAACAAGTFAESAGTSDCVPCPVGTFASGSSAVTCANCPSGSYAYVPGAAACVRCVAGRAGVCTSTSSCNALGSASSGYAVATSNLDASTCSAKPAMFADCAASTLSFFVKATCEVVITPLNDPTATPNGLTCSTPDNADFTVTGYYTSDTTIMTLLTGASGSIVKVTKASGTTATLTVSAATTDPNATPAAACSGTLAVTGAKVVAAGDETCPAGSVASGTDVKSCAPCPAGSFCATSAGAADCTAGTASPILGATAACGNCAAGQYSDAGAVQCSSCPVGTANPTAGAATCASCPGATELGTVTCDNSCGLKQFRNPVTGDCESCPGGYGVASVSGVPTCVQCAAGQESPADSVTCDDCASGSFSANAGTETCSTCPAGTSGGVGATSCTSCSEGQEAVAGSTTCTACASGFYRAGSGSAANARCTKCPSGYLTNAATGATTCTKCRAGEQLCVYSQRCNGMNCAHSRYSINIRCSISWQAPMSCGPTACASPARPTPASPARRAPPTARSRKPPALPAQAGSTQRATPAPTAPATPSMGLRCAALALLASGALLSPLSPWPASRAAPAARQL